MDIGYYGYTLLDGEGFVFLGGNGCHTDKCWGSESLLKAIKGFRYWNIMRRNDTKFDFYRTKWGNTKLLFKENINFLSVNLILFLFSIFCIFSTRYFVGSSRFDSPILYFKTDLNPLVFSTRIPYTIPLWI